MGPLRSSSMKRRWQWTSDRTNCQHCPAKCGEGSGENCNPCKRENALRWGTWCGGRMSVACSGKGESSILSFLGRSQWWTLKKKVLILWIVNSTCHLHATCQLPSTCQLSSTCHLHFREMFVTLWGSLWYCKFLCKCLTVKVQVTQTRQLFCRENIESIE